MAKWPFDPFDSKWLQVIFKINKFCRQGQAYVYEWVTWPCHIISKKWCIFGENDLVTPVTHNELPLWPQMTPVNHWPHNIGRGSQTYVYLWVLWSIYIILCTCYSIFGANYLFTPVTPNDPRLTFDPITKVKGLQLMHMYESYGHTRQHGEVIAFFAKMTIPPMTPKWPQFEIWPHNIDRSQADAYVWVLWLCYATWMSNSTFSRNDLLTGDPKWLQVDNWPKNINRGSQADAHVIVFHSYYATWMSNSTFSRNDLLTGDPKWPQVDNWPKNINKGSQADAHVIVFHSCYKT